LFRSNNFAAVRLSIGGPSASTTGGLPFFQELPLDSSPKIDNQRDREGKPVRAAWISDVHLGTRTSNAASLLQFLRDYDCDKLYVVGDLIDIWSLKRWRYWPQLHNDVIQKILRKARKGVPVIYIPGNHDEFVSTFAGAYGNISIQKNAIHKTADGRKILVVHGHELDTVVQNVKWLAYVGDIGYQFLLSLNPAINFVRRNFGLGYWSLSAYAKQRVKDAVNFIGEFEKAVARYAEKFSVDAVLCGHIHNAAQRQFDKCAYYNCGDWVESCTALIERYDGTIELVKYPPFVTSTRELEAVA